LELNEYATTAVWGIAAEAKTGRKAKNALALVANQTGDVRYEQTLRAVPRLEGTIRPEWRSTA